MRRAMIKEVLASPRAPDRSGVKKPWFSRAGEAPGEGLRVEPGLSACEPISGTKDPGGDMDSSHGVVIIDRYDEKVKLLRTSSLLWNSANAQPSKT